MSKFNESTSFNKGLYKDPSVTTNYESGLAFEMDAKTELVTVTLASFVEGKFYTGKEDVVTDLKKSVKRVLDIDPVFVLQLAAYARNVMNLRSVSLFLLNEYANSGISLVDSRKYVNSCIGRVDEISELLALSISSRKTLGKKKSSMFIIKGLRDSFNKFDAYQFGKYKSEGKDVTTKDALLLCHPIPKNTEQQLLFDRIVNDILPIPETWEVAISRDGSTKEAWESVFPSMGYMSVLKNLRNFVQKNVNLEPVINKLTDPHMVSKSKQYPFRYFSAYKALKELDGDFKNSCPHSTIAAIEVLNNGLKTALELSIGNIPNIPGNSLVLVDVSGSMKWSTISEKSKVTPAEIAGLFGAISSTICENAAIVVFASKFGVVTHLENKATLEKMDLISNVDVGGGTEAHLPMEFARSMKLNYDRIFLFSDMQCYSTQGFNDSFAKSFIGYQREVNPNTYLYSIDLTGYGTAQVPQPNDKVLMLSGFSEKLFEFIPKFESDRISLVKTIGDYTV